jgi:aspartokinase/homoserine dehydrogenase 1
MADIVKVLKFGGSSICDVERVTQVVNIIDKNKNHVVVVLSAFGNTTDDLIYASNLAKKKDSNYLKVFDDIKKTHIDIVGNILKEDRKVLIEIKNILKDLENFLKGIFLIGEYTSKTLDYVMSFGERLSSYIISNTIDNAMFLDSRDFIKTDDNFGNANVNIPKTYDLIRKKIKLVKHIIVGGFISSNDFGDTTTLGRGGSDYTASLIAGALKADILEIWTDVDGFMTADPKKVSKAYAIKHLNYEEAMELSHFGACVIYSATIKPALKNNIPIKIKNSYNPDFIGTDITKDLDKKYDKVIKGISSIDNIDLITLKGLGLIGISGMSMRLFSALSKKNINVIMTTQASSEYSISIAISNIYTNLALIAIKDEFLSEIEFKSEIKLSIERSLSILAIVGKNMKNTPGVSGVLFATLGKNGINVIATSQGSSELNISVVIKQKDLKKALNIVHESFFLSKHKEIHLHILGVGTVGSCLIKQIESQKDYLLKKHKLKINIVSLANSKSMLIDSFDLSEQNYRSRLKNQSQVLDLNKFVKTIVKLNLRNSVFIDCTASKEVSDKYYDVLKSYINVVSANKIACSSSYDLYQKLNKTAQDFGVKFIYETNVGAGLPIIKTIKDLKNSGDRILKIEAVLSGTLNFIFNTLSSNVKLSEAIKMAQENGFSEPDPRIDLSGVDVVRKILILARESGYVLEKEDVVMNPFLPAECFEGNLENFWKTIKKYDLEFEEKRKILQKNNKVWRYIARLDNGKCFVKLSEIDISHPAYDLKGSNNIISITSSRYSKEPMVIKGYGAGADVTAAGVFANIIEIVNL